jgi:transcriptional antiterminator RfaH
VASWTVAMTKAGCEQIAAFNLKRQGYTYYLPLYRAHTPGQKVRIRALFPRYIFIHIEETWYSILGTYGISRLLMVENHPCQVADEIITDLKAKEDKRGFVNLEPKAKFKPGDIVKVSEGPLVGYPLLVEGMSGPERVKVLIDMLGRKVNVVIDEKTLEPAA